MRTKSVSISLPIELLERLQFFVEKQSFSKFTAQALTKALDEKQAILRQQYIDAENDPVNKECINDWDAIELEGLDE
jgi:metal-responsive CopG/Arc/MetJ family transcriptional regulator